MIRSRTLQVEIWPEVGGKIGQIRHSPSGQSLLIPAQRPYVTIPAGKQWVDFDTSGMDDCFPNIDEGPYPVEPWRGLPLPQMGEWVYGSWNVVSGDEKKVELKRTGSFLPYRAWKQIAFAGDDCVRLCYRVENTGTNPFAYMWAAHPLLAIQGPYSVRLPPGPMTFITFPSDGQRRAWPSYNGMDLSHHWIPNGENLKIFVVGLREGWCELELEPYTVRFEFDLATTPVLGIWFNNFGFPGRGRTPFRCVAIEPCTSPSDVLHALAPGEYRILERGAVADWAITMRVHNTGKILAHTR